MRAPVRMAATAMPGRRVVRLGAWSVLVRARVVGVAVALVLLAAAAVVAELRTGQYPLSVEALVRTFAGHGTRAEIVVVRDDLLPRALVAVCLGLGLGAAGGLTQSALGNPLATPDVLGVTAGAGAATVALFTVGGLWDVTIPDIGPPLAAVTGGLVVAAVIAVLAAGHGSAAAGPLRIVLLGVGMTWLLDSVIAYLLSTSTTLDATVAQRWLVGSLAGAGWSSARYALVSAVVGLAGALALRRGLSVFVLGDDVAGALGRPVGRTRVAAVLVAVVAAATAVAAAGPVAFVALLAPQIGRRLTGLDHPDPVISALTGAALVPVADVCCRVLAPQGLPVGVLTAGLGGPLLVYLVVSRRRREAGR